MKILMSGSTGLVGSALIPALVQSGHEVTRLVRTKGQAGLFWDLDRDMVNSTPFEGFGVVIHLAGENIASGRWNAARKKRLRDSRIRTTKMLVTTLTRLKEPPATLICASAVGFYGNRGNEVLKEGSAAGKGFLAELCRDWEAATLPATQKGIRVVNLRFGVILSPAGGALAKMLVPFKLGLGGKIGSGGQFMSWIALDDVTGSLLHVLNTPALQGPINVVAPQPTTNLDFTKTLGRVLARPTFLPMPALAAHLVFGEMGDELLLASQRVEPKSLTQTNYRFLYPTLEGALRHLLS